MSVHSLEPRGTEKISRGPSLIERVSIWSKLVRKFRCDFHQVTIEEITRRAQKFEEACLRPSARTGVTPRKLYAIAVPSFPQSCSEKTVAKKRLELKPTVHESRD